MMPTIAALSLLPRIALQSKMLIISISVCSIVKYNKRGAVHGITYTINNKEEAWTPVVGRRSKIPQRSVPLHLLHLRAPPQVKSNLPSSDE
jgi:hypothetical protein